MQVWKQLSIGSALVNEDRGFAETRWSDSISAAGTDAAPFASYGVCAAPDASSRRCEVDIAPADLLAPIRRIGGVSGWYAYDWLWWLRRFIDLLADGVGMRRGRPDPEDLKVGDTVDWWRVEVWEPDQLLRLRAEMKVPGRAWLQFEVIPTERGTALQQTAEFDPSGLAGLLYWYAIYPLHALVFRGMLSGIVRAAQREAGRTQRATSSSSTGSGS